MRHDMRPTVIVCREVRGRVWLLSPTGDDLHEPLRRAFIPSSEEPEGRRSVRRNRVPDARVAFELAGWRVCESRARREAA